MPYIRAAKSGPHSGKRAATLFARPIAMPACSGHTAPHCANTLSHSKRSYFEGEQQTRHTMDRCSAQMDGLHNADCAPGRKLGI